MLTREEMKEIKERQEITERFAKNMKKRRLQQAIEDEIKSLTIDELEILLTILEDNKEVLQRLATCGDEYYTAEQMKKSFENNKKLSKNA